MLKQAVMAIVPESGTGSGTGADQPRRRGSLTAHGIEVGTGSGSGSGSGSDSGSGSGSGSATGISFGTAIEVGSSGSYLETDPSLLLALDALDAVLKAIGEDKKRLVAMGAADGAIKNVLILLETYECCVPACEKGLLAVAKLCRYGSTKATQSSHNVKALGNAGACELVTRVMARHMYDSTVAEMVRTIPVHVC
jgi:hypothetical protein